MENQGLQVLECSCGWQCHEADKPHGCGIGRLCPQCESTVFYPLWNVFNHYGQKIGVVAGPSVSDAMDSAKDAFDTIPGLTVRPKCVITD